VRPYEKPEPNKRNEIIQKNKIVQEIDKVFFGKDSSVQVLEQHQNEKLTKEKLDELLFQLGYGPYLKNRDNYTFESQVFGKVSELKAEVDKGEELFHNIWLYSNPTADETTTLTDSYELIKALATNVQKVPDEQVAREVARVVKSIL